MSNQDLKHRVDRVYAAMSVVRDEQVEKRNPVISFAGGVSVCHDFADGKSGFDLENDALMLCLQIVHLYDHLRKFLSDKKDAMSRLEKWRKLSRAVCLLTDLANSEKHGGPSRASLSGHQPQLRNLNRSLQMKCGGNGSTFVMLSLGPDEKLLPSSDGGSAAVTTTGDLVDHDGTILGEFSEVCSAAIDEYESICRELGVFSE